MSKCSRYPATSVNGYSWGGGRNRSGFGVRGREMTWIRSSVPRRYALALLAVGAAVLFSWPLHPLQDISMPLLVLAVLVSAWYGGAGAPGRRARGAGRGLLLHRARLLDRPQPGLRGALARVRPRPRRRDLVRQRAQGRRAEARPAGGAPARADARARGGATGAEA